MAVRITKPAVNIREKLAELERPIGVNGAALMATSTPQDAFSLIGAGRRNMIINGKLQVSQRGTYTSSTNTTSTTYYLDRWYWNGDLSGTSLQHKLDQTVNGITVNTLYYTTTSASYFISIGQQIESNVWSHLKGRNITMSAWVKTNNSKVGLRLYTGVQNIGPRHSGNGQWEYLVWKFTIPSDATSLYPLIDNYTGSYNAFANEYVEFTMVQLEEGNIATPFEHRMYAEELRLCQRYYFDLRPSSGVSVYPTVVESSGTDRWYAVIKLPVTMRTTPTLNVPGTYTGTSNIRLNWPFPGSTTLSAITGLYFVSPDAFTLYGTKSSSFAAAGNMVGLEIASALTSTIGANAEI